MAAKFEDSNIAFFGTDVEKNLKKAAAETEPEWKGAGAKPGIEIWRIEKFQVKKWPKEQYGQFYSGDSYIVLHSYKDPVKPESEKLLYNVHFWLGKDTSQDEAGTAAYKTVELDDLLGQLPVQYREIEGYESNEFLDLFKPAPKILKGGVDSGFNKVKAEDYRPRLMHVKGKKHIRVQEVPLAVASLNNGDVFVLDLGLELIQWNGSESAVNEKRRGNEVAHSINADRLGKAKITTIDADADYPIFWEKLGGTFAQVKSAADGGSDEKVSTFTKKLLRVSDKSGKITITEVSSGNISLADLDKEDVFIVDTETAIFIWIGSGATKNEKGQAFKIANQYLVDSKRPITTPVVRVIEGAHSSSFEAVFAKKKH